MCRGRIGIRVAPGEGKCRMWVSVNGYAWNVAASLHKCGRQGETKQECGLSLNFAAGICFFRWTMHERTTSKGDLYISTVVRRVRM